MHVYICLRRCHVSIRSHCRMLMPIEAKVKSSLRLVCTCDDLQHPYLNSREIISRLADPQVKVLVTVTSKLAGYSDFEAISQPVRSSLHALVTSQKHQPSAKQP